MSYAQERFYGLLKQNLMGLLHKIDKRNQEHSFEFDPQRDLSIGLRRFEPDFYKGTFYPSEEKKRHIDEFVRKACGVIHQCLKGSGRTDLTTIITVGT